jgi:hypothetical protein
VGMTVLIARTVDMAQNRVTKVFYHNILKLKHLHCFITLRVLLYFPPLCINLKVEK